MFIQNIISDNAMLAQILCGIISGLFGFFIPSKVEKQQSKIGLTSFSFLTLILFVLKALIIIAIICFINVQILHFFNIYPLPKGSKYSHAFTLSFLLTAFCTKYMRYLYFKERLH